MAKPPKYATVNHTNATGRITFSNNGKDFLELANDSSNALILKIPQTVPVDEKPKMYHTLVEEMQENGIFLERDNKEPKKLAGEHTYSVVIPLDPQNRDTQLRRLIEFLGRRSFLSGDSKHMVSLIPPRYESENGTVLSPYAALEKYASITRESDSTITQAASDFVNLINEIKTAQGEDIGYAANINGRDGTASVRIGR